jgi:hypothetical protein
LTHPGSLIEEGRKSRQKKAGNYAWEYETCGCRRLSRSFRILLPLPG